MHSIYIKMMSEEEIMVMVKFKENGRCGVFGLEQIKIRPCGKVIAPFGLVQMRECEIIEYVK